MVLALRTFVQDGSKVHVLTALTDKALIHASYGFIEALGIVSGAFFISALSDPS